MTDPVPSKASVPGPKQPPRIHGDGCICGDYTLAHCPAKDRKRKAVPSKDWMTRWSDLQLANESTQGIAASTLFCEVVAELAAANQLLNSEWFARVTYKQQLRAAQARIDALMLEHCPDEMTPEQRDNWAEHQEPAPEPSKGLVERLRWTWADHGIGHNSEYTDDMMAAADEIERQKAQVATLKGYIERTALNGYRCAECAQRLTATCLGGCGASVPSADAYCSACFLRVRAEQRSKWNKAVIVQDGARATIAFETEQEADAALEWLHGLGSAHAPAAERLKQENAELRAEILALGIRLGGFPGIPDPDEQARREQLADRLSWPQPVREDLDAAADIIRSTLPPNDGFSAIAEAVSKADPANYRPAQPPSQPLPDETRAATSRRAHGTEDAGRPGPSSPLTWETFWQKVREVNWTPSPDDLRKILNATVVNSPGTSAPAPEPCKWCEGCDDPTKCSGPRAAQPPGDGQ